MYFCVRGGLRLEGPDFITFVSTMLQMLERLLKAPSGSFLFAKRNQAIGCGHLYFFREIELDGVAYFIGVRTDWPARCGGYLLLLDLAAQEVCDHVSDGEMFRPSAAPGKWAYDYSVHDWHTPESLAHQVYEAISQQAFSWIRRCLGLDPLVMSHIADMSYETDAARGTFVFRTGQADDRCGTYRLCPKPDVSFEESSARFIRKQLAGAGDDSVLFVRDNADYQTKYVYCGYLVCPESDEAHEPKKQPVTVLLTRGGGWVLQIDERPVLFIKHRDVCLPSDDLDPVRETIDAEFGVGTAECVSVVLETLREQEHGTSAIFLNLKDPASREMAERLEKTGRALRVEDVHINEKEGARLARFLKQVSRIDGAQICDLDAMCVRYVNAIVDGFALIPGQRDCGARHNALTGAIANLCQNSTDETKAVAVIFSEDGGISAISTSECRQMLKKLKEQESQSTAEELREEY